MLGGSIGSSGIPFSCDLQLDSSHLKVRDQAFWLSKNRLFDEEILKYSSKELAEIHQLNKPPLVINVIRPTHDDLHASEYMFIPEERTIRMTTVLTRRARLLIASTLR